jgi:hypothetical protein
MGIVKLPQDLGTVALCVLLTVAPDPNLWGCATEDVVNLTMPGGVLKFYDRALTHRPSFRT